MTVERRISELPEAIAAALTMSLPLDDSGVTRRMTVGTLLSSMETLGYAVGLGPQGVSIRHGSGIPDDGIGNNGDAYLNVVNGALYTRVSGAYILTGSILGATGGVGDTGTPGAQIHLVSALPTFGIGITGDIAVNISEGADGGDIYDKTSGGWELAGNIRGAEGAIGATIAVNDLPAGITPIATDRLPINQTAGDATITIAQLTVAVGQAAETVDALPVVSVFAGSDELLTRQGGTDVLRGAISDLMTYVFSQFNTYTMPKLTLTGSTTIAATTHAGRILIVTGAGTITFNDALWADGQRCFITNHATVPITLASTTGTMSFGSVTNTLAVGAMVEIVRYTYDSVIYYKAPGASALAPITVNTPGNIVFGAALLVTGSYGQSSTTSLQYSLDGGNTWLPATGAALTSGVFSFSVAGVAASATAYVVHVRDTANTALAGVSGQFMVSTGALIAVTTPTGVNTGQNLTIAGTYTGTPTSIQYSYDATGVWNTLIALPAGGVFSGSVLAPATAGAHTVTVRFSNATSVTAVSGSFTMTAVPYITIVTPADHALGSDITVSGTYGNFTPTGFDRRVDSGSWVTTTADTTFGSGIWSRRIPTAALTSGTHTISIRFKNSTGVVVTTATFAVIDYSTGGGYDPGEPYYGGGYSGGGEGAGG